MTSYHRLYITTKTIPRTSIFNLPYGTEVTCTRVRGWALWDNSQSDPQHPSYLHDSKLIAGEYEGPSNWLVLDVDGHIIVDSRSDTSDETGTSVTGES